VLLLILLVHLISGVIAVGLNGRLGRGAFTVAAVGPVVTLIWLITRWSDLFPSATSDSATTAVEQRIDWIAALDLGIDLRVDAFGALMMLLVAGIGLAVCVYALGYFSSSKPGVGRLAGLMALFAGAMHGLVMSDHLIALFVFWELTSVTSYLLIGNDDTNPRARDAALHALLVTGAGGLAMLAGLILLGHHAGTYSLSTLAAGTDDIAWSGALVSVAVVLVLLGAFSKSAQWPLSGWLPGAMVAPTPISTYLHAATMVKAGVFLVARLAPVLGETDVWRPLVLTVGSLTMVYGGWRALRQFDLKLLLAYGTVSQLGLLMVLFGAGVYDLAQAAVVLIIAHGAFKAALFMVVGIVDHRTHTRDIRRIGRLGPAWRPVQAVALLAAASMAGVPPLLGFIGKEKALLAAADGHFAGARLVTIVIVAGSILTFAYSGRFVLGVMGRFADPSAATAEQPIVGGDAQPPRRWFLAPATVLVVWSVAAGVVPRLVDTPVRAVTQALYPASSPKPVALWTGWNTAVVLTIVIMIVGVALVSRRGAVTRVQDRVFRRVGRLPTAERSFWALLEGTLRNAKRLTGVVQNGSLPVYVMVILGVVTISAAVPAVTMLDVWPRFTESWVQLPVLALTAAAALGATLTHRRIAAALMLGAVGYSMAIFFVVEGAPDLALTQFAIETLATVLFVLVLRVLPRRFSRRRPGIAPGVRVAVAVVVGVGAAVLALAASTPRDPAVRSPLADTMLERSLPDGKGANVVNVILVDFRGMDTLGEITVLLVAALGVVALTNVARRRPTAGGDHDTSVIVSTSTFLLFASISVLSLYFLFAGHNQPGGGFVGGLTAGGAISLAFIAGGLPAVRRLVPVTPWVVAGTGLTISATTALVPVALGHSVLEHALFTASLPVVGDVKFTSALFFDIGVYLVVVGLVLMVYEAFGERADRIEHADESVEETAS